MCAQGPREEEFGTATRATLSFFRRGLEQGFEVVGRGQFFKRSPGWKTRGIAQLPARGGVCLEPILREACSRAYPVSAICVQRFDDSLSSAIRITYRISLRSSSLREPRYPLLRVVLVSYV